MDWLAENLGLDRIGNEALGMSLMMHRLNVAYGRQPIPDEDDSRTERYSRHGEFAGSVLGHDAFGVVDITIDAEAVFRSDEEEPEHMTAR